MLRTRALALVFAGQLGAMVVAEFIGGFAAGFFGITRNSIVLTIPLSIGAVWLVGLWIGRRFADTRPREIVGASALNGLLTGLRLFSLRDLDTAIAGLVSTTVVLSITTWLAVRRARSRRHRTAAQDSA